MTASLSRCSAISNGLTPYLSLAALVIIRFLSDLGSHLLRFLNIVLLAAFVATHQQQIDRISGLHVVHPIPWSGRNAHLEHALPYRLMVSEVTFLGSPNPPQHSRLTNGIFQPVEPAPENACVVNSEHRPIVSNWIHIIKVICLKNHASSPTYMQSLTTCIIYIHNLKSQIISNTGLPRLC